MALPPAITKKPDRISSMHTPINAIIFDFGGVLLNWDPRHLYQRFFPSQPQAMESFLKEIDFYNWNAQQDKGRTFSEGITNLTAQYPQHAHLIQAYFDYWEDSITGSIQGTVDILQSLKQKGYPLYGLSNWSAETFPRAKHKYPFFDWFDEIILSGAVGLIKPDPAIFNLFLSRTGYSDSECLLIDDSQPNIDSAQHIGFKTIHFSTPEQLQLDMQRLKLL